MIKVTSHGLYVLCGELVLFEPSAPRQLSEKTRLLLLSMGVVVVGKVVFQ